MDSWEGRGIASARKWSTVIVPKCFWCGGWRHGRPLRFDMLEENASDGRYVDVMANSTVPPRFVPHKVGRLEFLITTGQSPFAFCFDRFKPPRARDGSGRVGRGRHPIFGRRDFERESGTSGVVQIHGDC